MLTYTRAIFALALILLMLLIMVLTLPIFLTDGEPIRVRFVVNQGERTSIQQIVNAEQQRVVGLSTVLSIMGGVEIINRIPAVWSADAERFVFAVRREGTPELWLGTVDGQAFSLGDLNSTSSPGSWSVDNHHVAYERSNSRTRTIYVADATTGGLAEAIDFGTPQDDVIYMIPAWSPTNPDLMAAMRLQNRISALVLIDLSITPPEQTSLYETYAFIDQMAWSPDGKTIVFRLAATSSRSYIERYHNLIDIESGAYVSLDTYGRSVEAMRWSPDGKKLMLMILGGQSIYIVDPNTDTLQSIFDAPQGSIYKGVAWSTDGNLLAVIEETGSTCTLTLIDLKRQFRLQPIAPISGVCHASPIWDES